MASGRPDGAPDRTLISMVVTARSGASRLPHPLNWIQIPHFHSQIKPMINARLTDDIGDQRQYRSSLIRATAVMPIGELAPAALQSQAENPSTHRFGCPRRLDRGQSPLLRSSALVSGVRGPACITTGRPGFGFPTRAAAGKTRLRLSP
jgi:hypothetical protein